MSFGFLCDFHQKKLILELYIHSYTISTRDGCRNDTLATTIYDEDKSDGECKERKRKEVWRPSPTLYSSGDLKLRSRVSGPAISNANAAAASFFSFLFLLPLSSPFSIERSVLLLLLFIDGFCQP